MEKNIRRMCGIDESSRRRGFAGFALEVFYIDFIEAGCSRKAPFVIRTKDQWEAVKRVSKWAAAYYTHPNSYYKLPTSHVVSLPHIKIPKPTSQKITRNEEAEMRAWAKMHGKSVRQRNVRQDNTMDRVGTSPLNLYETETVLKPVNLNSQIGVERVPSESDEPPNSNEDASLPPESPNNERVDIFSASDSDSDSEEEVDSALETMNMIRPTRLGRVRTLTSRMADFLQARMAGM